MARKVKMWTKTDAKDCFAKAAASGSSRPMKKYGECMAKKALRK